MIPPHFTSTPHPASLVYTDPMFRLTVDVARHFAHGHVRGFVRALLRGPAALFRVLFAVARLPILDVTVTTGQAAAWFSRDFAPISAPIYAGRWAQAVLDLDPDDEAYLAGRKKQALRTNMRHARRQGIEVARVAGYDEWAALAREILDSRPDGAEMFARLRPTSSTGDVSYFVAVDEAGLPVATNVIARFSEYAVLVWSLTVPDHPAASASRYLLHTFVRSDLRRQGVRHLIAGTGVREAPGLHYFQHLLGYDVRNLRIRLREASDAVTNFAGDPRWAAADEVAMSSALG